MLYMPIHQAAMHWAMIGKSLMPNGDGVHRVFMESQAVATTMLYMRMPIHQAAMHWAMMGKSLRPNGDGVSIDVRGIRYIDNNKMPKGTVQNFLIVTRVWMVFPEVYV